MRLLSTKILDLNFFVLDGFKNLTKLSDKEFKNKIHVLIVDHNIRKDSYKEAVKVKKILNGMRLRSVNEVSGVMFEWDSHVALFSYESLIYKFYRENFSDMMKAQESNCI